MKTVFTLADLRPDVTRLPIACSRCDRRGRLSVLRLLAEHGPGTPIWKAVDGLSADCPRREASSIMERCDVYFPGLAGLVG